MFHRLKMLLDKSALMMIVPAVVVLFIIAPAMAATLVEWSIFAFALVGVAILITRITFPQMKLTELVHLAKDGELGPAIMSCSIVLFVAMLVYSLVIWAKA